MVDINVLATKDYPLRMIERAKRNKTGYAGEDSSCPASVWHSIA
jgi:hypothetical protein